MDWTSPEQMERAEMNAEQAQFMQDTIAEIAKRGTHLMVLYESGINPHGLAAGFQQTRQDSVFEHDYYFISQLYDLDWKPVHTI
jgi:hypothetical protein